MAHRRRLGKRAIFFTLMAIGLVTILTFFFVLNLRGQAPHAKKIVSTRMDVANDLVVSFSTSFVPLAVRTTAVDAVTGLIDYMSSSGKFITNASGNLTSIMLTGNISPSTRIINDNETLVYKLDSFVNKSREVLYILFNYTLNDLKVVQDNRTGAYRIAVEVNLSYLANNSLAVWNMTHTYTIDFDIMGFKDPLYMVATGGRFNNTINRTSNDSWTFDHFKKHMQQGTYKREPLAPSFLQRFENKTIGSSCCGIESIFYNATLYPPYITRNLSYVDYCFFTNNCTDDTVYGAQLFNITGISTGTYPFRIRAYHMAPTKYNLTDYLNGTV